MLKFWLFILINSLSISCENRAPPMDGICEDIIPERYEGIDTKDHKRCNWKGYIWKCWYQTPYRDWICDIISVAPVEQTKMEPVK